MTEYGLPNDTDLESAPPGVELEDAQSELPTTGAPTDAELPEELPEAQPDPGNRAGVHDRAGDTQDFS